MTDDDGTCEYVLDPDDPETWGGEEGDECDIDKSILNKEGVWNCPYESQPEEDLCIFHLPIKKKDDSETVEEFLKVLEKFEKENRPKNKKIDFINSKFGEFKLNEVTFQSAIDGVELDFSYSTFEEKLEWKHIKIDISNTIFNNSTFNDGFEFNDVKFNSGMSFYNVQFNKRARFEESRFYADITFCETEFSEGATFSSTEFCGEALFRFCAFDGGTSYDTVHFKKLTKFDHSIFSNVLFFDTIFEDNSVFSDSAFIDITNFQGVKFVGDSSFRDAEIRGNFSIGWSVFESRARFEKSEFLGEVSFSETEFEDEADFTHAHFNSGADFSQTKFRERADFSKTTLTGIDFEGSILSGAIFFASRLKRANFESSILNRADLNSADLRGAKIADATLGDIKINQNTRFLDSPSNLRSPSPHTFSAMWSIGTCVYDPDYEEDNEHENMDKAKSVYRALEELGRKHARPRLQARSFVRRQDLQKQDYWDDATADDVSLEERFIAGARWSRAKMARATLLYGESPWRVISWSLGIIFSFALLYPLGGWMKPEGGDPITYAKIASNPVEILNSVYYSTLTYTALGFGDFKPVGLGKALTAVETGLGAVMLALLVFILGRRAAR